MKEELSVNIVELIYFNMKTDIFINGQNRKIYIFKSGIKNNSPPKKNKAIHTHYTYSLYNIYIYIGSFFINEKKGQNVYKSEFHRKKKACPEYKCLLYTLTLKKGVFL